MYKIDTFPGFEFRPELASIPSDISANRLLARKVGGKKEKRRRKKAEPPFQKIPRKFFKKKLKGRTAAAVRTDSLRLLLCSHLQGGKEGNPDGRRNEKRETPLFPEHTFFSFYFRIRVAFSVVVALTLHYKHFKTTQLVGRSRGNRAGNETKDTRRDTRRSRDTVSGRDQTFCLKT